jgi:hypothetical protein
VTLAVHRNSIAVESILQAIGPCLSSRLCAALEEHGLSAQAARQRVSRAGSAVKRLQGLIFPRGVRFLYHESTFNSHAYWEALVRDVGQAAPAYAAAIAALEARGGVVPLAHFDIISGSPVLQKGQIASATVLERLTAVRLVEQIEIPGVGSCVALDGNGHFGRASDTVLKARLRTEQILLLAVKDWARKLGVGSYNKIALRDDGAEPPKVGTVRWDLAGPSYLSPMVSREKSGRPRPGFFVCDAVVGERIDDGAIAAFTRKCDLLGYLRRVAPILPLLIADRFTHEALQLGRSRGIIMATPGTLFGREVAEGLASLLTTLTKAAAVAARNPEVVGELFEKLSGIEGAASNLRGALFEMIVGHCVQKCEDGLIDIGKLLADKKTGKTAEVDVFRVKEDREVWCYECKAHQPTEVVDLDTVTHWVKDRIPVMQAALRAEGRFQGNKFHHEFWTCGTFDPDALTFMEQAAGATKKYAIGWKDGPAVRKYAAQIKRSSVLKVLDEHFFNHPLTRVARRYPRGDDEIASDDIDLDADWDSADSEDLEDLEAGGLSPARFESAGTERRAICRSTPVQRCDACSSVETCA